MQIGEVAARTELSLRTIRHYEETAAARKIEELHRQLARAEEFAATLRSRLEQTGPAAPS
ncbi:hypothetical protein [Streptomyces malaysiensis]|uniref:HTH merR-type domain-containing protein n=1 Tax=Streptomyces malaysiensis subsp. samsunensis TaxID=459658 RepID=A0A9X2M3S4_STRMQ|nr:hypothetical protein [Streptomyces samsunensis]MCQ8834888.1 hypothetical protein [Streptomyces samsunensis]